MPISVISSPRVRAASRLGTIGSATKPATAPLPAQLVDGALFDVLDPTAGNIQLVCDVLQGVAPDAAEAVAQPQDALLTRAQMGQAEVEQLLWGDLLVEVGTRIKREHFLLDVIAAIGIDSDEHLDLSPCGAREPVQGRGALEHQPLSFERGCTSRASSAKTEHSLRGVTHTTCQLASAAITPAIRSMSGVGGSHPGRRNSAKVAAQIAANGANVEVSSDTRCD